MKIDLYLPEKLQQRIDQKMRRLEELKEEATAIGSPSMLGEKVMSSPPQGARFEEVIFRQQRIEKELHDLTVRKSDVTKEILKVAWQLPFDEQDLIIMRYINLQQILPIAEHFQVSYRTVQRRLKKAKQHFREAEDEI